MIGVSDEQVVDTQTLSMTPYFEHGTDRPLDRCGRCNKLFPVRFLEGEPGCEDDHDWCDVCNERLMERCKLLETPGRQMQEVDALLGWGYTKTLSHATEVGSFIAIFFPTFERDHPEAFRKIVFEKG